MKKLLGFLVLALMLCGNANSKNYLTPWGLKITVSDNFLYLGKDDNLEKNCKLIEEMGISKQSTCEKFYKNLSDGRIIYIVSKNSKKTTINANRQSLGTTIYPTSQIEANQICNHLRKNYETMTRLSLEIKNCVLEYVPKKINTNKFKSSLNNKIKSILHYSQGVSKYNRTQSQYFIHYDNYMLTFTTGCQVGECKEGNDEIINIINSINF
ncbi:hypothetical protein OAL80_02235 [Pelagibacteraceae bacterium]|nr:hypothetical protein [Pelagibacteraceae bacterium]